MKVSARGKFAFTVKNVDEDASLAMIEVNGDSPRTYRWLGCPTELVHVEDCPDSVPVDPRTIPEKWVTSSFS